MATEEKMLKMDQVEKDFLLGLFAAAGIDASSKFLPEGPLWVYDPDSDTELVLAKFAIEHR